MDILGIPLWLYLLTLVLGLIVYYMWYMSMDLNLFEKLGIDGPGPMPLLGNLGPILTSGLYQSQVEMYKAYKHRKVFGVFDSRTPCLVVTDLKIIEEILTTCSDKFPNRQRFVQGDSILFHSLPLLEGDHWKRVRDVVCTHFSDPEKLRQIPTRLERTNHAMLEWLNEQIEEEDDIDLRQMSTFYNVDSILNTCYGIEANSFQDPEYDYISNVKRIDSKFWWSKMVQFFVPFLYKVCRFIGLCSFKKPLRVFDKLTDSIISKDASKGDFTFLRLMSKGNDIVVENSDILDSQNVHQLTIPNVTLSEKDVKGQSLSIALSSYNTVSTVMSYTLFMLANNPEWCQVVQEEIDALLELENCVNFDNVRKLVALDMCIYETMRMFPSSVDMDRVCLEDVTIQGFRFPKGMPVYLPMYAIHNDRELWSDPEEFEPERFSPMSKAKQSPFAFLPFGAGPRTCVGKELALLVMKIGITAILRRMIPSPSYFTVYPPKLSRFSNKASDGLWIKMEHRS